MVTKIDGLRTLSIHFNLKKKEKISTDIFAEFERMEPEVYTYMASDAATNDDYIKLLATLYMDPRLMNMEYNKNRLLDLCLQFLKERVAH